MMVFLSQPTQRIFSFGWQPLVKWHVNKCDDSIRGRVREATALDSFFLLSFFFSLVSLLFLCCFLISSSFVLFGVLRRIISSARILLLFFFFFCRLCWGLFVVFLRRILFGLTLESLQWRLRRMMLFDCFFSSFLLLSQLQVFLSFLGSFFVCFGCCLFVSVGLFGVVCGVVIVCLFDHEV